MGKLTLTPRAQNDLFEIWATIAGDNPRAADLLFQRLMHKMQLAADSPFIGSPRPELSLAARILIEGRYLAIYEPQEDGALVIAIVHGMGEPGTWLR